MKTLHFGRLSLVAAVATVLLSFASLTPTAADDLTPEQQDLVKTNCATIKTTLGQLHVSDALLRVNRGQFYESMSSRLMSRFNARLASNGIDNVAFTSVTSSYGVAITVFRNDYINYEQKLSDAIAIDCKKEPAAFHQALGEARDLRKKVHNDVLSLNQLLVDYQTGVNAFADSYSQVGAQQ